MLALADADYVEPAMSVLCTSERTDWPVVVIGGGPAGAMAAHQLTRSGVEVLLVDKARFPRPKVCGGCLGSLALQTLEDAGLGHLPAQLGGRPLNRVRLVSGGVTARTHAGQRVALSRLAFDDALISEAASAGATIWQQSTAMVGECGRSTRRVTVRRPCGPVEINAGVVVMATGLASCLPADAGIKYSTQSEPRLGFGGLTLASRHSPGWDDGELTMAVGSRGYVGVVCTEANQLDIAAALDREVFAQKGGPQAEIANLLQPVDCTITQWINEVDFQGSPPLTRYASQVAAERLLLVGDAAGYSEPFTGEGIGWALAGGTLAAQLISQAVAGGQISKLPQEWCQAYAAKLARRQKLSKYVCSSLRYRATRKLAMAALRISPAFASPVLRAIDGTRFNKSIGGTV